jgi:hypothetical protein
MTQTQTLTLTPLPPAPGKCPECATEHEPGEPHNRWSLFYQVRFQQAHGRSPDWADAMAHCSIDVQQRWIEALTAVGQRVLPESEAGS